MTHTTATADDGPYQSDKERWQAGFKQQSDQEFLDAESLKQKYEDSRKPIIRQGKLIYVPQTQKTKALTSNAMEKNWDKIIIYCPTCKGAGRGTRMLPYRLDVLLHSPEVYAEVVGGLSFSDDTIFLHCSYCNLRLLPQIDEVEKLDARLDEEYVIESLTDPHKATQKPVMAASSSRFNKARKDKEQIYRSRKNQALERLSSNNNDTTRSNNKESEPRA